MTALTHRKLGAIAPHMAASHGPLMHRANEWFSRQPRLAPAVPLVLDAAAPLSIRGRGLAHPHWLRLPKRGATLGAIGAPLSVGGLLEAKTGGRGPATRRSPRSSASSRCNS